MPANEPDSTMSGHCIAGVIDAEGHFAITEHNGGRSVGCSMTVAMRDDDVGLLHAMASTTRLGVVRRKDQRGNSQAAWVVYRKDDVAAMAAYLKRYPLRSRKRHDFDVWSRAVEQWHGCDADRLDRMQELRLSIRDAAPGPGLPEHAPSGLRGATRPYESCGSKTSR